MSDASSGGYKGLHKKKPKPKPRKPPPPRSEAAAGSGYSVPSPPPSVPPRHTVFSDPVPTTPALHDQQRTQRDKVRRAQERLPGQRVPLPRFPTLKHYTPAQRKAIIFQTSKVIHDAVASGNLDEYLGDNTVREPLLEQLGKLTDRDTRRAVHKYAGALSTQRRLEDIRLGRESTRNQLLPVVPTLENLAKIGQDVRARQAAGHAEAKPGIDRGPIGDAEHALSGFVDDRIFNYAPNLRVATLPIQLTRAFVEDPVQTTKSSVRTGVEMIAGIPQGIKALIDDPREAVQAMGDDISHRYGPLVEGDTGKFREQVQEESGVTPFVLETAAVGGGVGRVAGAAARSGAVARTAEALAAANEPILSRVLKAAHETATMERPNLRYSGGEGGVKPQATSRNLFVAGGQRALDNRRRAAFEKRAERAGLRPTRTGELEQLPNVEPGRLPGLRPGPDEVLPYYSAREGATRRMTGRIPRDIGGVKSKGRIRLLTQRGEALQRLEREMEGLSMEEAAALMPTVKYGLPAVTDDASRAAAVRAIDRRLAILKRNRKQAGFKGVPVLHRATNDEVRLLRELRRNPEALTPRLRAAADEMLAVQRFSQDIDPDLTPEQTLIRRDTEQGKLLGVRRGPDEDFFRGVLEEIDLVREARGQPRANVARSHDGLAALLPDERPAAATKLEAQAKARLGATERVLAKAREDLAKATGRAEVLSRNVTGRETPTRRGYTRAEWERLSPVEKHADYLARVEIAESAGQVGALRAIADATQLYPDDVRQAASDALRRIEVRREGTARTRGALSESESKELDALHHTLANEGLSPAGVSRLRELRLRETESAKVAEGLPPRQAPERQWAGGGLGVAQARAALDEAEAARGVAADAYKAAQEVTRAVKRTDTMRLESAAAFDTRVRKAAEEAGLEEPGYWMSTPRPTDTYSDAAIGSGGRGIASSKRYTGALSDLGIETHTPEVLRQGVERNIKRRFSWSLVARNVDVHSFDWSRGKQGEGLTAKEMLKVLDDRRIDPTTVAFINTRVARRGAPDEEGLARGRVIDRDEGIVEDELLGDAHEALTGRTLAGENLPDGAGRVGLEFLQNEQVQGQAINRYLAVPKEVADELERATLPDGAVARTVEIILKQKPARILLGALNIPWLMFQIASNAMLTGLGGARNPFDIYAAQKWFRSLPDAQRDAIEVELGITRGRHFGMDQVRLGSTKSRMGPAEHLVNFWQGYKTSRVGRELHKVNPLDLMFRADEAQNNFFRKILFYNQAKKTAYRDMGANWRSMDGLQKKLMATLGKPPEEMGKALVANAPVFEKHAKVVNDFLGNYLTFSNRERQLLSRNIMFYGYLRFSLRFAFWTMPVEHPIMTAMLANIGRLGTNEIKELFGVPDDYRLPTSMLGRVYSGASPEEVREYVESEGQRGKLPLSVNIGRMNPGLNALTSLESEQQIVGLASPLYQALADQLFEESSFTGRDYRINGQTTPAESQRPKNYFGSFWSTFVPGRPRNRILLSDLLGLVYPYRLATKTGIPALGIDPLEGPQSDDSLLWSPRPMQYKDEEIVKSIERSIERERESGAHGIGAQLLPFTPTEDLGPVVIAREREKEADAANQRMKKPEKKKRNREKAGSYGGTQRSNPYGGTSTSYKDRYGG